ncbi:hypothetical protein DND132_1927 [Pseudodesulfovibrio mercurii]|uniref:Uncharacterized protein n=1 Tax=Pseudodesulfovibrio mercurii TaxID=641491 RepID=F0JGU3_9BACT|nr:hypothetical protein [Pseudodesulfovibrio mercurii]EGB15133.1 hypothetical protein DND132_1927 [Pseudodesulfovibrio mercurii]
MDREYEHRPEGGGIARHPILMLAVYAATAMLIPAAFALVSNDPVALLTEVPLYLPFLGPLFALGLASLLKSGRDPRPLGGWPVKVVYAVLVIASTAAQWRAGTIHGLMLIVTALACAVACMLTGIAAFALADDRGWKGAFAVWLWLWLGIAGYYAVLFFEMRFAAKMGLPPLLCW